MNEHQQAIVQRFIVVLAALRELVNHRGVNGDFTFDEIWDYAPEEVDSQFRSNLTGPFERAGYIQRTGQQRNARLPSRRSSRVEVLLPGLRLKRDKFLPSLFYRLNTKQTQLPDFAKLPCITLTPLGYRAEDDQSESSSTEINTTYKTAFELRYHSADAVTFIGVVKILQQKEGKVQQNTSLPDIFAVLNNRFISLGQNIEYYKQLEELGEAIYEPILSSLNDIVLHQGFDTSFEADPAWRISLLRFSEAEKAYREAPYLFHPVVGHNSEIPIKTLQFTFICQVPGAQAPHRLSFNFSEDPTKLNRIAALIGRNGTGKTQVLAQFANEVSGYKLQTGIFEPQRPSFSKVIAISYSIFDDFDLPSEDLTTFSYIYCGIRQKNQLLNQHEIRDKLFRTTQAIRESDRYEAWKEIIATLLSERPFPEESPTLEDYRHFYESLSSGQRILALVMSEVILNIREDSIILFDEPELHLHPEAISMLTRALHKLLDQFKSYAVIATHSPIILQEIPAKFVIVLKRQGNYPLVKPLQFESFGENLSNITDEVFGTTKERYNYREHLRELAKRNTYKQILEMFDNRLSFNARAFLSTLYSER